jgi:hypothetical protein
MKREEELAHQYLASLGYGSVLYEPEPNLPPDFLIDGHIAVEVRRLNQNEVTEQGHRGLEETWIPFNMRFRKLLKSFGPPQTGETWFVTYRIQRPLTPWDQLRPTLTYLLREFLDHPVRHRAEVEVDHSFEMSFYPASKVHPTVFIWGAGADGDSGGFTVHEMLKNLRICVADKTQVVAPHRHKYPEWWLVFLDFIGYGLIEYDQKMLRENWKMQHDWDKIIIVNPLNPLSAYELTSVISE